MKPGRMLRRKPTAANAWAAIVSAVLVHEESARRELRARALDKLGPKLGDQSPDVIAARRHAYQTRAALLGAIQGWGILLAQEEPPIFDDETATQIVGLLTQYVSAELVTRAEVRR